jgi:hypothetical protein
MNSAKYTENKIQSKASTSVVWLEWSNFEKKKLFLFFRVEIFIYKICVLQK